MKFLKGISAPEKVDNHQSLPIFLQAYYTDETLRPSE